MGTQKRTGYELRTIGLLAPLVETNFRWVETAYPLVALNARMG
ncbi:hypothetical protein [Microvirga ossetica]|nr:hypothetical protein [Microvirga ossetica]